MPREHIYDFIIARTLLSVSTKHPVHRLLEKRATIRKGHAQSGPNTSPGCP